MTDLPNNTSDGTEDPNASYDRALEEILNEWAKHFEPATHATGRYGIPKTGDVVDWQLTISKDSWKFHKNELAQRLTDLCTKRETLARGQENHYWIDKYSREIKALDGFTDKPEKDRLKRLRRTHQDRLAELRGRVKLLANWIRTDLRPEEIESELELLVQESNKEARLDLAQQIYNLDVKGEDWRQIIQDILNQAGELHGSDKVTDKQSDSKRASSEAEEKL